MALKHDGPGEDWTVLDRWDGGATWLAHPEEHIQRTSHALVVDDEVWLVDPLDVDGLDDWLGDLGTVAGVVVLFAQHKRDAAALANRHDVSVHVPRSFRGVAAKLDAPVVETTTELADTGYGVHAVRTKRVWQEAMLFGEDTRTLVVSESLGTAPHYLTGDERVGVHPMMRPFPPKQIGRLDPDRLLVGHGASVTDDPAAAIDDALAGSRRRAPNLWLGDLRDLVLG